MASETTPQVESETQAMETQCCVCFQARSGDMWTCHRCSTQCHMQCIFQWVLRQQLNTEGASRLYTCPMCRTPQPVNSLPGFHDERTTPRRTGPRPHTAILGMLSDLLPAFDSARHLPPTEPATDHQTIDETSGDATEATEGDDDESESGNGSVGPRAIIEVKTRSLHVSIQAINLYGYRHP
jgi:hypothetical protein